jgi:hypothetical protein
MRAELSNDLSKQDLASVEFFRERIETFVRRYLVLIYVSWGFPRE